MEGRMIHHHLHFFLFNEVNIGDDLGVKAVNFGHFELHLFGHKAAFTPHHRLTVLITLPYLKMTLTLASIFNYNKFVSGVSKELTKF